MFRGLRKYVGKETKNSDPNHYDIWKKDNAALSFLCLQTGVCKTRTDERTAVQVFSNNNTAASEQDTRGENNIRQGML